MAISRVRSLLPFSSAIHKSVSSIYRFYSSTSSTHFEVSVFFFLFFLFFFLPCLYLDVFCSATTQASFTRLIFSWVSEKIDGLVLFSAFFFFFFYFYLFIFFFVCCLAAKKLAADSV